MRRSCLGAGLVLAKVRQGLTEAVLLPRFGSGADPSPAHIKQQSFNTSWWCRGSGWHLVNLKCGENSLKRFVAGSVVGVFRLALTRSRLFGRRSR
jgi:hypothetical protein